MMKLFVVIYCIIILCSLFSVPLLKPTMPASQDEQQSIPQSTSQPITQPAPESTPQSTLQPSKSIPISTPQITSQITLQPLPVGAQKSTNRTIEQAIGNATNYLAETREPFALLMLNVLYRRFGITEFNDSLQTYDELLAANPANAPLLRVYRRIADYNNTVLQTADFNKVSNDLDRLTVPALYSDRIAPQNDYLWMLINAYENGSYLLTHALLAAIYLQDNHCTLPMPDNFIEYLYHMNSALIGNSLVVTDLELEAAAFLCLAGQRTLVNDAFVQRVIATQNYDGGWCISSDSASCSSWHTSVLGLMLLLHIEFPSSSYPPVIAPA